jgi:excisionase family DNA binding protein
MGCDCPGFAHIQAVTQELLRVTRMKSSFPQEAATSRGSQPYPISDKFAYRISEACTALGIGRTSLYKLVNEGKLRLINVAGRSLVPRSELERLTRIE